MTGSASGPAALEMERAHDCLRSAKLLSAAGQHADAISRAYFAVFHGACALLASIGRSARAHDGVRAHIAEHFVRPGILAPAHGRALSRMAADRNDAEYNVAAVFGEADVRGDIAQAEAFLSAVEPLLAGAKPEG